MKFLACFKSVEFDAADENDAWNKVQGIIEAHEIECSMIYPLAKEDQQ